MYDYGRTPYEYGYETGNLVPVLFGDIFDDGVPDISDASLPDEEFYNPRSHDPRLR